MTVTANTVDDNRLYRLTLIRLGSELAAGIELSSGTWVVEPLGPPPYGSARPPEGQ